MRAEGEAIQAAARRRRHCKRSGAIRISGIVAGLIRRGILAATRDLSPDVELCRGSLVAETSWQWHTKAGIRRYLSWHSNYKTGAAHARETYSRRLPRGHALSGRARRRQDRRVSQEGVWRRNVVRADAAAGRQDHARRP